MVNVVVSLGVVVVSLDKRLMAVNLAVLAYKMVVIAGEDKTVVEAGQTGANLLTAVAFSVISIIKIVFVVVIKVSVGVAFLTVNIEIRVYIAIVMGTLGRQNDSIVVVPTVNALDVIIVRLVHMADFTINIEIIINVVNVNVNGNEVSGNSDMVVIVDNDAL